MLVSTVATIVALVPLSPWLLELRGWHVVLCGAFVAITSFGIIQSVYSGLRPVSLISFVFLFSWLGVAPIYQLSHGIAAWRDAYVLVGPGVTTALVLNLMAATALLLGFRHNREPHPNPTRVATAAQPSRVLAAIYLLACTLLLPSAISASGGFAQLFGSRTSRGEALAAQGLTIEQVGGARLALTGILPAALAAAALTLLAIRLRRQVMAVGTLGTNAVDGLLFLIALCYAGIFANPFTSARSLTIATFGSLLLLLIQPRSRRAGIWMLSVALVGTLVAYPLANVFRGQVGGYATGFEAFASPDFDGFQQVVNGISFARDEGYRFGGYSVSALLYFVPRSLWADKARPASYDVAEHRGYDFLNLSLPIHAELYIDYTVLGMLLAVFVVAKVGGHVDRAWLRSPSSRAGLLAPYICLASLMMIRGPLGAAAPIYLSTILLIWLGLARRSNCPTLATGDEVEAIQSGQTRAGEATRASGVRAVEDSQVPRSES